MYTRNKNLNNSAKSGKISLSIPIPTERKSYFRASRISSIKFPLHALAAKGRVEELKVLIKCDPSELDDLKKTPLHYACAFPHQKKALEMVEAILDYQQPQNLPNGSKKLVNYQDENGETALHLAAKAGHPDVVMRLIMAGADLNIRDNLKVKPLTLIYKKVPSAMITAYEYSVSYKDGGDPDDGDHHQNVELTFNFMAVGGIPEVEDSSEPLFFPETEWLSYCLDLSYKKQEVILTHPYVQTFLLLKWKKVRYLLWLSILFHVVWLFLYIYFNVDLYLANCPFVSSAGANETDVNPNATAIVDFNSSIKSMHRQEEAPENTSKGGPTSCDVSKDRIRLNAELGLLFLMTISVAVKELYEIYSSRDIRLYFLQLENIGQWMVVAIVFLASVPIFQVESGGEVNLYDWNYQASSFGILLSCSLMLSQIGKLPRFGIYILILAKVVRSFVMFMITFAAILIAFMISFQILMPEKSEFTDTPWGFIKILTMMAGEINYDDVFHNEEDPEFEANLPFPITTKILFAFFMAIVTIILFNLLIGLTVSGVQVSAIQPIVVSDIQGLQSEAELHSLSLQVQEIHFMETVLFSNNIQRLLKFFKKHHWLRFFLVTQQHNDQKTNTEINVGIRKIPKGLQRELLRIASSNIQNNNEDEESDYDSDMDSATTDDEDDTEMKTLSKENIQNFKKLKKQINAMLQDFMDEVTQQKHSNA